MTNEQTTPSEQPDVAKAIAELEAWRAIAEALYCPPQGNVFLKQRGWVKSRVEEKWYLAGDGRLRTLVEAVGVEAKKLFDGMERSTVVTARERAIADAIAERTRQIEVEGWTPSHDDDHTRGELAQAAACYAAGDRSVHVRQTLNSARGIDDNCYHYDYSTAQPGQIDWPFDSDYKPTPEDRQRELTKAIALLLAEKERLYRLSQDGHG